MKTCNGKNIYESQHRARIALKVSERQRSRKLRVYPCKKCFGWHLTSEPKF